MNQTLLVFRKLKGLCKIAVCALILIQSQLATAQSVTVTQPNGGEVLYGCQTYLIKWTSSGVSNFWNIDYSLNGGSIWSSVATNLNITNGQYSWTVPMVASSSVLVRVLDYNAPSKRDSSNAVFTIQLPITVTVPNGGEIWQGLSSKNITWTPAGTSGIFNLFYSINNGGSWNSIATNIAANNYTWNPVPNNPSTQALIRVQDATTACQQDQSDLAFEISAAQPILITPNGGESWFVDQQKNITWNTSTFFSSVQLEFSTDSGATYNQIVSSTSNTGSYSWTIPNTPSSKVLVRASNVSNTNIKDVSNAVFSITRPNNFLTSPNGGENWVSYSNYDITWDNTKFISPVKIEYSTDNGIVWNVITNSTTNNGTYTWLIPKMNPTSQALIRITNTVVTAISDTSNATFNILEPVSITNPNTFGTYTSCGVMNINWTVPDGLTNYLNANTPSNYRNTFDIYTSINGGPYNLIYTEYHTQYQNSYSYAYTIPDVAPANIKVKIITRTPSILGAAIFWEDSSTVASNIIAPTGTITVTAPNGGVNMNALTNYNITWTASGSSGFYNIQYSLNGGLSYSTIASNVSGNNYVWSVPNLNNNTVFIRVQDNQNTCRKDASNAANAIVPATPILTSPNGGEQWKVSTNYNITWNTATFYTAVGIEYSIDSGATWNVITASTSNTGLYTWNIPNNLTDKAYIKIYNVGNPSLFDVNNAKFSIVLPKPVLTFPNGGEITQAGSAEIITWDAATVVGNAKLEYSRDSGLTWFTIVANTSNTGTYSWIPPAQLYTGTAYVRLSSTTYTAAMDTSNSVFTIRPQVYVSNPNTVGTYTACANMNINWIRGENFNNYSNSDAISAYRNKFEIYTSVNNGPWSLITVEENYQNQLSYSYAYSLPDIAPANIRVRIIAKYNTYQYGSTPPTYWDDSSDFASNVIQPTGTVTVLTPNGGVNLNALTNYNITWTASGTSGFYDVGYSTSATSGFTTIASNIATNNYLWTIPNLNNLPIYIKVRDYNNNCRKDASNATNTVIPATPVLTYPNGGEVLKVNSNANITWNTATFFTSVMIEFSIDNGANWNIITTATTNNGVYGWTVPNAVTNQALIRVSNVGFPASNDVSNATFTINLPSPIITSPNGGENFQAGSTNFITWDAASVASNVKIEYSRDSGLTWNIITASTANTGNYSWTPPSMLYSTGCWIRLTNVSFPSALDTSNAFFTIRPYVWVYNPNTVATYTACANMNISWSRGDNFNNYSNSDAISAYRNKYEIYTSVNNGPWSLVTVEENYQNQTSYTYSYSLPDIAPATIKVMIIAKWNTYQYGSTPPTYWIDSSDVASNVIAPTGTVTVLTPNGGVNLNALSTYNITWSASGTSGFYDVGYSTSPTVGFTTIASNIATNNYLWTIPNLNNIPIYIKVRDYNNNCRKDASNASNTVIPATPVLTYPNGGEVLKVNSNANITWNTATFFTSVMIEFSIDNGANWNIITNATTNNGTFAWTVPNAITNQALIRVSNVGFPASNDVSNSTFTINLPSPIITSPNGGENWQSGSSEFITWDAASVASNVKIEYSRDSGLNWNLITASTANTGTYTWTPPSMLYSTGCWIRLTNVSFPSALDTSNAYFTIRPPVWVFNPNSVATYTSCANMNISWSRGENFNNYSNSDAISAYRNKFEIYTSVNNGPWTLITTEENYQSQTSYNYSYTLPDIAPATIKAMVIAKWNTYQYGSTPPTYWTDSSDNTSNVIAPTGTITVTNPNGGVNMNALTNYNITWTASGTSGFYDVGYSFSPTSGFSTIVSNISANNYTWSVPNMNRNDVYIKVRDYQNNCRKDVSNGANTIIPTNPVLTFPNGGEKLKVNTNYNITWNAATFYNSVVIDYSIDNGASWNSVVAATSNTGSYLWTIPNVLTTQALIRVYNFSNPSLFDVSNAVFEIYIPKPVITFPNGGEILNAGTSATITWDANTVINNVILEYSNDSGNTWSTIVNGASNSGTYNWTPPSQLYNTKSLIRLITVTYNSARDTSNAVFSVEPYIYVSNPNMVGTYTACGNMNIVWDRGANFNNYTNSDAISTYRNKFEVYTSVNNGPWNIYSVEENYQNTYSYGISYPVPDVAPATIRAMVIGKYNTAQYGSTPPTYWIDSSDFNSNVVQPSGTITVLTPNGGINLNALTTYNITWSASGTSGFFDVQYSTNGGVGYSNIATNINGNSYTWSVPNLNSNNVIIRVRDNQNNCRKDVSNSANTIVPATPVLTSPNGGEIWNVNSTKNITWNTATLYTSVVIELSTDNGATWNYVTTATSNTGTYAWTVPFTPSNQCKIKISNFNNPSVFDVSDNNFTIQIPNPVLLTANGGETWYAGTVNAITWTASTVFSPTVNLEYTLDNGLNWITIASNLANSGSYNWTIPNVNSTSAKIRISNTANTAYNDVSDALFTLRPYVRITTPNGGNTLGACTQTSIGFERSPFYSTYVIEYSIDNGTNWLTLQASTTYSATFNTYNWSIPNTASTQVLVRVYPTGVIANGDQSDAVFTIKRAVTIIQPNFGGVLVVGSSYPIKWQSDGISNFYDIAYSTTGPTGPWINIILNYNTSTNNYNWTVPNAPSTNCYIRVRDNGNVCKEDISDVAFSISTSANPITVTAPNGTDSLNACSSYNITWTEVGGPIGTYNISYSIDGGSNYIPIVSNYATTSYNYSWVVPNISAAGALVRVQSAPNPSLFDISNALFTILPGKLTTNKDTTICLGSSVQINTTGGSTYTWTPVTGLSSSTIANPVATPTVTTSYIVSSVNGSCALSDTLNITVINGGSLSASVSVVPTPGTAICNGSVLTLNTNVNNGGTNPSYQWKKNGTNVGVNSPTFITSTAANGDVFSCIMTSNLLCVSNNPAISNNVTMTVFNVVSPSVSIATSSTTICSGANTTFTATPNNGGSSPVYQWKKNNVNVGTNSNTYVTNSLSNNDVISLEMTSNANCATPTLVTSNSLLMTVNPNSTPSINISATSSAICTGTNVTFTANASNAGGSPTYQWKINGSNVGTNSSTFASNTLANNDIVTCDVTSSATCNTISTVSSNAIQMSVSTSVVPSVSISANTTNICAGSSIIFTAVPTNGGTSPSYQWKVNNINAGTNSSTYSTSALNNNDSVTCVMTSNFGCASPASGTSNKVKVVVNPTTPPSITINASQSTICAGTNITYTATPTNGGATPSYQWVLNGNNVGGNSATYNSSAIANQDSIWCIITSGSSCASPNNATSNVLKTTVNPVSTPAVSIGANNNNICTGANVLFTATPTNGGSTPSYQWKVNGSNVGTNSATYSSTSFANGDLITCVMTSNISCATVATATSNGVTMTVTAPSVPTISISTATTTICSGTAVTFNSNITNGGGSPSYQWKINGTNVSGATNSSFTLSTLANSDAVSCVLTSSANCASPTTASSNTINMVVNTSVTPSISISASTLVVCAGNSITFTATPTNGGTTPVYQWKKNGTNVGTNSPTYITSALTNLDQITCDLTSNALCATTTNVSSNAITIGVNSNVVPTISISTASLNVCSGANVTFNSSITNGGGSPTYVWKKNNVVISGANSSSYSSTTFANNDIITCELTSNASCASPLTTASNPQQITINAASTPSVVISTGTTVICGTSATFTATPTNGGATPSYQWKLNGTNVGTNSTTYTNNSLSNNDAISCVMTPSTICASPATANSNTIIMTVSLSVVPSITVNTALTNICSGANVTFNTSTSNGGSTPSYQWYLNGTPVGTNSNSYSNNALANNDSVWCVLTSSLGCASPTIGISNKVKMIVNPVTAPTINVVATSNNICAGTLDTFTATAGNISGTPTYQWKINGTNVGGNSPIFISSTLNNNDTIRCTVTSSNSCSTPNNATSTPNIVVVNNNLTPSLTISTPSSAVCSGANVTFTATPTNGGSAPSYQWKVNGSNVGTNSNSYSSSSFVNGDIVTCVLTSSASCLTIATANSNAIAITINASSSPSVNISGTSTICSGTNVNFSATPTNGGSTPSYQWKLNGSNVGSNAATYSNSALVNGDNVTCVMTTSNACATQPTANSNTITMVVNSTVVPAVSISASSTNVCAGSNATITATPTNGGTTPSYQWKVNGNNTGTNSNVFSSSSLLNGDVITCVMTSNANCASPLTAASNNITMTISNPVLPTVSISASSTNICSGSNVTFTASSTNGGTTPTYQWKVNGSNVGTNSSTFNSSTLSNNDNVTCQLTSNANCISTATVNSNTLTMTVNNNITPTISISTGTTTICSGTNTTFTSSITNGGANPSYQWKVNGSNVGTNSSTFSSSTLSNSDQVTCVLTSNGACLTANNIVSNTITMTVNAKVSPDVTIAPSANNICVGTNVTFTATPTNGGTTPSYQWKVNGINAGTNSPTFSSSSFANNDNITCYMTSNATCLLNSIDTSNAVTMIVNAPVSPTVSISASSTTICSGASITFTATPTNGGTTPTYQWKVNGVNAGTNSNSFVASSLINGDIVSCVLTTSLTCVTTATANSNVIGVTVNAFVTPTISISTGTTTICEGTNTTFSASITNGGTTPSYQWKINGTNVGINSSIFSTTALVNNDQVTCVLTSNNACLNSNNIGSNTVTMTVNSKVAPDVSIAPSANNICVGTNVTFTATPTNGGTTPSYQWKVNGINAGTNSSTFASSSFANSDIISCVMTSNATCLLNNMDTSNTVSMIVNTPVTPSVSISASTTNICSGASITFTATPTNGGTTPTFQWKVNGINAGTNSNTFVTSTLSNTDNVSCVLTTSLTCVTTASANSNVIGITVNANVTPTISINTSSTTICAGVNATFNANITNGGSSPVYQWKVNGGNVGTNSASFSSSTLNNGDLITCELTSNATCKTTANAASNTITMTVTNNVTPIVSISPSANNVCLGTNITFTATPTNGGTPSYQWKVNGSNVGGNSATYIASNFTNGQTVNCVMTSSITCVTSPTANSNNVTMTINTPVTPSVSISANKTTICAGQSVTFNATPTNGGTPSYQWKINGINTGTNSDIFTTSSLLNSDVVTCVMTSSLTCVTATTGISNAIAITVNAVTNPTIAINTTSSTICSGANATFTTSITNGGSTPTYQWFKNGLGIANSSTFASTTLANSDTIYCVLTSSDACANPVTKTSNKIVMTVNPSISPSVSISSSGANICPGVMVNFTANATNAGTSPTYQWQVNGGGVGTNSPTYSNNALNNSDVVRCIVTPTVSCAIPAFATSNTITITHQSTVLPSVSIIASANSICPGQPVTFTATPTNGGLTPTYQWLLNGNNVGTNSSTYFNANLLNNDVVSCEMISSLVCASPSKVVSTSISMIVNNAALPTIGISTNKTTVCEGEPITFTASATNAGTTPTYIWKLNGINVGGNTTTYTTSTLKSNDSVTCTISTTGACSQTVESNKLGMTVKPRPATPIILVVTDSLKSSVVANSYIWLWEGTSAGFITRSIKPFKTGNYRLIVEQNGCLSDTSNVYKQMSSAVQTYNDITIFAYPNESGDKLMIKFPAQGKEFYYVKVLDITGKTILQQTVANDQGKGELNTQVIASGIYTVIVENGTDRGVFRLAVTK